MDSKPHRIGGREKSGFERESARLQKAEFYNPESNLRFSLARRTKYEPAGDLARLVVLVNLDTDQMSVRAQPIHPPHATLPPASNLHTPILVRLGNAALRVRARPQRVPLLGGGAGQERLVHGVEHVEVRQHRQRLDPALLLLFAAGDDDEPGQLRRAQDEAQARRYRRLCRRLR